ncbi:sigma 54-interacting transcriptional regulator [Myxococcota bacterium]|nr:sigma 54-interacting transcriptional regulator [Myxococcota bacterium]
MVRDERAAGVDRALVEDALGASAGAVLLLDEDLKIVAASAAVEALLGVDVPLGTSAPALLCGDAPKRPIADALVEGRPVQATLPRRAGARTLKVRSIPLTRGKRGSGALVLLDDAGEPEGEGPVWFHGMWTNDARMKEMFRIVERVAKDDVTVLVRGETGTGKELVATAIHKLSDRRKGPFRAINCAALPANLLESELFGHARGAFTGALRDTPGHVELADKGTLFLDEVAELPLELQAKLLRVLETHSVIPVGAREPIPVDVRVVSATHRALRKEVEAGRFRADLMYRIRVIPIFIPALRERRGDVRLIAEKLLASMNETSRRHIDRISPAAIAALERHTWPGNVRELRNALSYAYAMGDGPILQPSDLPPELVEPHLADAERDGTRPSLDPTVEPEARELLDALDRARGSRQRAAELLGISRVTLWRRMRQLGLDER